MKLSADPLSDYYDEAIIFNSTIYFNDVEIKDCIEADSDEGYVIQFVKDDKGAYLFNPDSFEFYETEKKYGKVVIEVPEEYKKFL